MQSLRHILATAGLRPFDTDPRGTPAAIAMKLCADAGSPYHSAPTMRYFNCKIHAIKVVADGAAYVALESMFRTGGDIPLYRPVVIDCAGRVADTVGLEDCTPDEKQAKRWYAEKLARYSDETYAREFVKSIITEKIERTERALTDLNRGLMLIVGEPLECTLVRNDANGNARYVVHYLNLLTKEEAAAPVDFQGLSKYQIALNRARSINGRKFHNKQYGGGIVFTALSPNEIAENVSRVTGRLFVGVAD